ncbi:hypothetical protein MRB53_038144 [Persea americana]|nr:hypothetical protein MRB53_038144 [Persea americana]
MIVRSSSRVRTSELMDADAGAAAHVEHETRPAESPAAHPAKGTAMPPPKKLSEKLLRTDFFFESEAHRLRSCTSFVVTQSLQRDWRQRLPKRKLSRSDYLDRHRICRISASCPRRSRSGRLAIPLWNSRVMCSQQNKSIIMACGGSSCSSCFSLKCSTNVTLLQSPDVVSSVRGVTRRMLA